MLVTFFRYVGDFLNVLNRSPSWICHQDIKLVTNTTVSNIPITPEAAPERLTEFPKLGPLVVRFVAAWKLLAIFNSYNLLIYVFIIQVS